MFGLFKRAEPKQETRASASGFTAELIAAREGWISGSRGVGELTATAQSCVSLWEHGLSLADVSGFDLDRQTLALAGRALALRGEAVFLIREDRLIPAADWDLATRDGIPRAYRVSVSEAGGGVSMTALAGEVLHFRIGSDVAAPWSGTAPLKRSSLTAGLLHTLESALSDVYQNAPLGSQIVPFPEAPDTDLEALGRGFRGRRGRVLLRESVHVTAAGGAAPAQDWRPQDVTPDLQRAMTKETLEAARSAILTAFGVLPSWFSSTAQGTLVREAQRHLAQWTLQPIAGGIAEEIERKTGQPVSLDVMAPLQAYDAGGRARALNAILNALADAKAADVSPDAIANAGRLVNWEL
ncbi:phage portal protein [Hyphomonadaceae bacterium ML37]|nr:phage portal protein [Hyphomonadaceae bacterium ML37]